MPADPVRDAAVDVLLQIFNKGKFIDRAIDRSLRRRNLGRRGGRFLTQLVYGVTRNLTLLDHALSPVLHNPLKDLPDPIQMVLRLGVFQSLFCDNVPFPVMVHTSVDLAKKRGHAGTAKLVNAVLKRAPKDIDSISFPEDRTGYLEVRYSIPRWIVDRWMQDFGVEGASELCAACNEQAPTTIRVNTKQTGVEGLKKRLGQADCVVEKRTAVPEELTIVDGPPPAKLKLFQRGAFILQDPASMMVPHLLEPLYLEKVLDLCAAPGGKSTHAAQLIDEDTFVVAADAHPTRLSMVSDNVDRLGFADRMRLVCANGLNPPFRDGSFPRVMVDAPCSGLGTLRRHPDLKWRLKEEEIAKFAVQQKALLRAAVQLCENQGVIAYSVCTVTPEETEDVIADILSDGLVQLEDGPDWLHPWKIGTGVYRTLPSMDGLDGFFLTRLRKLS